MFWGYRVKEQIERQFAKEIAAGTPLHPVVRRFAIKWKLIESGERSPVQED